MFFQRSLCRKSLLTGNTEEGAIEPFSMIQEQMSLRVFPGGVGACVE